MESLPQSTDASQTSALWHDGASEMALKEANDLVRSFRDRYRISNNGSKATHDETPSKPAREQATVAIAEDAPSKEPEESAIPPPK